MDLKVLFLSIPNSIRLYKTWLYSTTSERTFWSLTNEICLSVNNLPWPDQWIIPLPDINNSWVTQKMACSLSKNRLCQLHIFLPESIMLIGQFFFLLVKKIALYLDPTNNALVLNSSSAFPKVWLTCSFLQFCFTKFHKDSQILVLLHNHGTQC